MMAAILGITVSVGACGYLPVSRTSLVGTEPLEHALKPTPVNAPFGECGPEGSQPDFVLNRRKNRVDIAPWIDTPWPVIARLPWPRLVGLRFRNQWTEGEQQEVARFEGAPVRIEGYLEGFKLEGREPPNCYSDDPNARDYHLWLAEEPRDARRRTIVVEITPRVRALHPNWTEAHLTMLETSRDRMRVSGWLMLDQMHPERVGLNRTTLWEVHPILQIDVLRGEKWVSLDSLGAFDGPAPNHPPTAGPPRP
ncbi:MAG: hypothetical protein M3Z05_21385 [Gemmatimonadota bacterium]|nr:hypothetical protein [Gemmatimonadota bacterium]